jgi:hypothetical protein
MCLSHHANFLASLCMVCRLGLLQRQAQDYEEQLAVLTKQISQSEVHPC